MECGVERACDAHGRQIGSRWVIRKEGAGKENNGQRHAIQHDDDDVGRHQAMRGLAEDDRAEQG